MIHRLKTVASMIVLVVGMAHAEPNIGAGYSRAELQTMIRSANSPQQYQALATYFRSQQDALEKRAQAEKAEWSRRSQVTAAVYEKYPRPVDSSQNRYEYLAYEASQMGQRAAHYESLYANSQQLAAK